MSKSMTWSHMVKAWFFTHDASLSLNATYLSALLHCVSRRFKDLQAGTEIHNTYHKQTGVDRGAAPDKCGCVPNGYVFV